MELLALRLGSEEAVHEIEHVDNLLALRQLGFGRQFLDEIEIERHRSAVRLDERPGIVEQIDAVGHAEFRQIRQEHFPRSVVVLDPVVAGALDVQLERAVARGARQLHRLRGHEQARLGGFAGRRVGEGNLPFQLRRLLKMYGETLLRQRDLSARRPRHFYDGETGLLRPGRRDFSHRFAGSLRERIPKIGRRGIREFVRGHVFAEALAKNIFPEKTFQHPDKRQALSVSDVIEGAVRFRFGCDRLLDGVRGRAGVAFHRAFLPDAITPRRIARRVFAQPGFPLRIEFRRALRPHPRREPFVEPEIVPPRHRDEIAEPHVGRLVRDHFVDALLRLGGRFLGIEQEARFVVGDSAPVLHRPAETARDRDVIQLRERVGDAEVVIKILEDLL